MRDLDWLYEVEQCKSPLDLYFDSLKAPSLYELISPNQIEQIYNIIKNPRLTGNFLKKEGQVNEILRQCGFYKFHAGTNRNIYAHYEYTNIIIKVAMDKGSLGDNLAEYDNQFIFKPFVTKVFEVHPTGVIGLFERVKPIRSREEFILVADSIFDMLMSKFIGKYVLDDIGTKAFMNYGFRDGFGPVLLDFPYIYELDGNKLMCTKDINGHVCGGTIDYDDGFNNLVCDKCGAIYAATDLKTMIEKKKEIEVIKPKGDFEMVIYIKQGKKVIHKVDTTGEYSTYTKAKKYVKNRKDRTKRDDMPKDFEISFSYLPEGYSQNEEEPEEEVIIKQDEQPNEEPIETDTQDEEDFNDSQEEEDTEVEIPDEEDVEVVESKSVWEDIGWSEEEYRVYEESKASITAALKGLNLTDEGYQNLLSKQRKYPLIFLSLLSELGIDEIPKPSVVESEARYVETNSNENVTVTDSEVKDPYEELNKFKEKNKPTKKLSPSTLINDKFIDECF